MPLKGLTKSIPRRLHRLLHALIAPPHSERCVKKRSRWAFAERGFQQRDRLLDHPLFAGLKPARQTANPVCHRFVQPCRKYLVHDLECLRKITYLLRTRFVNRVIRWSFDHGMTRRITDGALPLSSNTSSHCSLLTRHFSPSSFESCVFKPRTSPKTTTF